MGFGVASVANVYFILIGNRVPRKTGTVHILLDFETREAREGKKEKESGAVVHMQLYMYVIYRLNI